MMERANFWQRLKSNYENNYVPLLIFFNTQILNIAAMRKFLRLNLAMNLHIPKIDFFDRNISPFYLPFVSRNMDRWIFITENSEDLNSLLLSDVFPSKVFKKIIWSLFVKRLSKYLCRSDQL